MVVGFVIPMWIARSQGALGAARGDDWSYLVTLFRWVDTGRIEFNNWVSMSLLGQLWIAAPIAAIWGHATTVVQTQTAILGSIGLLCVLWLGRRLGLSWGLAALAALTIAVSPLWMVLSTTFMTDVPSFTFSLAALLIATIALQRRPISMPLLLLAIALSTYSVLIRQYAIVPLIAIVVAGFLATARARRKNATIALVIACVISSLAIVVFFIWWSHVPDAKSIAPTLPNARHLRTTFIKGAGFVRLSGLLLAPVLIYCGPIRIIRRSYSASKSLSIAIGAGVALWEAVTATRYVSSQFVGNYIIRDGALSIAVLPGQRPDVIPGPFWSICVLVSSILAVLLLMATIPSIVGAWSRVKNRQLFDVDPVTSMLGLTVAGFCCAYTIAMVTGVQVYDRYALPAIPIIALLLIRATKPRPDRSRIALTSVALLALLLLGTSFAVDSASFDGGRWRLAAQVAEENGWRPIRVNGGFEWVNFHRGKRGTVESRGSSVKVLADGSIVKIPRFCANLRVIDPHIDRGGVFDKRVLGTRPYKGLLRPDVTIIALRSNRDCPRNKKL
ncbi:Dolichyl-phosphate-mannose-protein mannosyltransferase [Actinobacteria bacterium IMCC26256]|nr:Dolichyl-phosphate-mannose-protein mannosyltransferase [Actinobacteria bacterium IMCC26256]